jgi:hypothetical protein
MQPDHGKFRIRGSFDFNGWQMVVQGSLLMSVGRQYAESKRH